MKKKNGFTLIELLAVIVILAIIALIVTPIVLNLIEKARKGAAEDSANGLRKAAQLYYSSNLIENFNGENIIFECNGEKCVASTGEILEIDGTIPKSGKVEIKSDGKMIFSNIIINGYSCEIPEKGNSKCTKSTGENTTDSAITLGEIEVTVNSIVIPYTLNSETSSDVALNNSFNNSESVLLAYNDSQLDTKEILLLNDNQSNVTCEYGTSESYGESGILQNNSCYITGLDANTTYYYKLTVIDSNGVEHTQKGNIGTSAYIPGEVIYFNPFTGEACYNYNYGNSDLGYTGETSGENQNKCLKWYVISYNDLENKLDIILDHNITIVGLSWDELLSSDYFSNISSLWSQVENVRHITADEIAKITGASSENKIKWVSTKSLSSTAATANLNTEVSWFYLDGKGSTYDKTQNGWQLATAKSIGASKYAWLYDNTFECIKNGCNFEEISNRSTIAYWTSTPINTIDDSKKMWVIQSNGSLSTAETSVTDVVGVRPVVTINKNNLFVKGSTINISNLNQKPVIELFDVTSSANSITIPFNVNSDVEFDTDRFVCEYGIDTNYGNIGTIENDYMADTENEFNCVINDLDVHTTYYYKITAIDRFNNSGVGTGKFVTKYVSGDAIKLGDYYWHVIGDDGQYTTLLMDEGQVSDMNHCTDDEDDSTDCSASPADNFGVLYSWDKSKIRTYLNDILYPELREKIENEIILTKVCADSSGLNSYGGFLISEIDLLNENHSINTNCNMIVEDYVRLISPSEFINLASADYSVDRIFPLIDSITELQDDKNSWFYSNTYEWWTMGVDFDDNSDSRAQVITDYAGMGFSPSNNIKQVRPVITIRNN